MSRAFPTRLTIAPPCWPTLRPRAARSTTSGVLGRRSATGGNAPLATLSAKNGVSTGAGWAKESDAVRQNAARAARSAALIPARRGGPSRSAAQDRGGDPAPAGRGSGSSTRLRPCPHPARAAARVGPPLRAGIRHPSHKGQEKGAPAIEIPPTITPPPEPRPPSCGLGGR